MSIIWLKPPDQISLLWKWQNKSHRFYFNLIQGKVFLQFKGSLILYHEPEHFKLLHLYSSPPLIILSRLKPHINWFHKTHQNAHQLCNQVIWMNLIWEGAGILCLLSLIWGGEKGGKSQQYMYFLSSLSSLGP